MNLVRPPAVAGLFYPGDAVELREQIGTLLARAPPAAGAARPPKLLIVPHAGYIYSGSVAAAAYALLGRYRPAIRRVVLLGPTHRVAVRGIGIPATRRFATPLGEVALDGATLERLARRALAVVNDAAHAAEHSLEVQLPFLQVVLGDFELVPLAVGHASAAEVVAVLEEIGGGEETVVLISSDLSHYHSYRDAQVLDRETVDRILARSADLDHERACGATPINGAMAVARRLDLAPRLLALCNSGDTAGDRDRVVGYCAVAFEEVGDAPR